MGRVILGRSEVKVYFLFTFGAVRAEGQRNKCVAVEMGLCSEWEGKIIVVVVLAVTLPFFF